MYESSLLKTCSKCYAGSPDYTTPCNHSFHLRCLAHYYHLYKSCSICHTELNLPFIQVIDIKKCSSCSSTIQLQSLECFHRYCIPCIITKKLKFECCENNIDSMQKLIIKCPTCEENTNIKKFSEINCPTHGSLCKKCYNLSIVNNECIGACGFKFDFALVGACFGCSKESLIYYSNYECSNNCLICIDCKAWYIINYGQSNRCYICSSSITS